jgi:hypothetical protein
LPKAGNVHAAHKTGAEAVGSEAVFTKCGELNSDRVDYDHIEQFRRGLESEANFCGRFGAPKGECQKASKKQADCRVDAEVVPLHEGTKFNKNSFTPRQP